MRPENSRPSCFPVDPTDPGEDEGAVTPVHEEPVVRMPSLQISNVIPMHLVSERLTRDITLQGHLDPTMRLADRAERFSRLLAGPEPTDIDVLRTLIAIGGIVRPLAAPPQVLSLNTPEQRRVMVDCAIASLRS